MRPTGGVRVDVPPVPGPARLSRIGQDSRVVPTPDAAQRDDLQAGRHDGGAAIIEALEGLEG